MKLTVTLRNQIATKIAAHHFDDLIKDARAEKRILGDAVYFAFFLGEKDYLSSLKPGWFQESNTFRIGCFPEWSKHPAYNSAFTMTAARRLPIDGYIRTLPSSTTTTYVEKALDAYAAKEAFIEELKNKQKMMRKELLAFLTQFTTCKKLLAVSPELEMFLPEDGITPNLPAINYTQITEKYTSPS